MFPHTITIYNVLKKNDTVSYNRKEVSNVFAHIDKIIAQEGKGDKYTTVYDVIFSKEALAQYIPKEEYQVKDNVEDCYTLKENDIVVIGSFGDITDLQELQQSNLEFFLIRTISDNRYGDEELQNIEITD